ncbi:hypothetical protein [Streptomyces tagetis]|uniref:Uncharacterized protein n=1 Tax=Streptomyces tagetis TaxID=2820809 RepID=A0A940XIM0_9ACTN|nr:hypothetical protein [Streptomyces sp. RG38]MBQ0827241.1 hypothetical protein [Streptomyces sp. RG38]
MTNDTSASATAHAPDTGGPRSGTSLSQKILWSVVVLSALANLAASFGDDLRINLLCGLTTAVAATLLALRFRRGRR